MKRQKVLIIDDEPSIVRLVGLHLEPEEGDVFAYDVEVFTDPHAALERARTQSFDAVISDYRMPAMDGIAFLKAFTLLQPHCRRMSRQLSQKV